MNIWLLLLCMMLVTFLPRVLPSVLVGRVHYSRNVEKFLRLIPYTAMTALVVPGIFSTAPNQWYVGVIGGLVAIGMACIKKMPLAVTVIASVLSVMLVYWIV